MKIEEAIKVLEKQFDKSCGNYRYQNAEKIDFEDAIWMAIEALKEKNAGWISVEDRLPENEQNVLVSIERLFDFQGNPMRHHFVVMAFHTDGKTYRDESSYVWSHDCIDMEYDEEKDDYIVPEGWWEAVEYGEEFRSVDDFVTHWMPLPKLPEEE